jgi:hypothetical protein
MQRGLFVWYNQFAIFPLVARLFTLVYINPWNPEVPVSDSLRISDFRSSIPSGFIVLSESLEGTVGVVNLSQNMSQTCLFTLTRGCTCSLLCVSPCKGGRPKEQYMQITDSRLQMG